MVVFFLVAFSDNRRRRFHNDNFMPDTSAHGNIYHGAGGKYQAIGKRNLQGLGRTGDLKIQGYPYSLTLYQLSYPEILLNRLVRDSPRLAAK